MKSNIQTVLIVCRKLGCGLRVEVQTQGSRVSLHSDEWLLDVLASIGKLTELRIRDIASVATRPSIIPLINKLIDRFRWQIVTHVVPPVHISPNLTHPGINHHSHGIA